MRRNKKRVKKTIGRAGGQPPAAADGMDGAMDEGKGQGVLVVGGGVAREAGRRALTALEFQGLAAVPHEAEWFANIRQTRGRGGPTGSTSTSSWGLWDRAARVDGPCSKGSALIRIQD
jgi:hypothetical protein